MTAYPSVYFIFVISESENDMYRSCIRSKFPIRGKIELQFANHGLHEIIYLFIYCIYLLIYLFYLFIYFMMNGLFFDVRRKSNDAFSRKLSIT